jgi:predicted ABC-type ATPase
LGDPFLLMIAGPNGAGKTTLFRNLRQSGVDFGEYINPDDIALELQGSYDERVRQAQTIADQRRDACIAAGRSLSFETVMSHPSKIDILARAKAAGRGGRGQCQPAGAGRIILPRRPGRQN